MDIRSTARKVMHIRAIVGFAIAGILFVAVGVLVLRAPQGDYAPVKATVDHIDEIENFDETEYHVYVDYEVDGKKYEDAEYGSYHTGMKAGDIVDAEYNVDDPADLRAPGTEMIPYVIVGAGIVSLLVSVLMIVKDVRRKQ